MSVYMNILEDFEENYLGYIALVVIGQSCLGSAAVMSILKNGISFFQMSQLTIMVVVCMLVNGAILAQMKPKVVLKMLVVSVVLSVFFIIFNGLM